MTARRRMRGAAMMAGWGLAVCLGMTPLGAQERASDTAASQAREGVRYTTTFEIDGGDEELAETIRESSNLRALADEPPSGAGGLIRRAASDIDRITAALYAQGYYGGLIDMTIAGVSLLSERLIETVEAASSGVVPVVVSVETGPRYVFGQLNYRDAATGRPGLPLAIDTTEIGIAPGEPARGSAVIAAESRMVEEMKALGYPLAAVASREAVADHATNTLDVTFALEPGPSAVFGPVEVRGAEDVDANFIARYANVPPGERYSPEEVERIRETLGQLDAFQSVRIVEGTELTPDGQIPLIIEVEERLPRFIGFGASYASSEGAALNAYWGHRNLFGGAERLRIEGEVSRLFSNDIEDLEYLGRATFEKPGVLTPIDDLVAEVRVFREAPDAYERTGYGGTIGIRRRFSNHLSGQISLDAEQSEVTDVFGTEDYTLIGTPVELNWDTTDNRLDPTEGFRARLAVSPYPEFLGSSINLTIARGTVSAYQAIDEARRFVLAGRVTVGTIDGPALPLIPADRRFYAGGGGSIRGYDFQSVSPRDPLTGELIGGKSLFEASAELRMRITETIGIVPFIDIGGAFASATPEFGDDMRIGAGVGLRYHTAIGPIRLDVATPIDRRSGDPSVAVYVGLGQAF